VQRINVAGIRNDGWFKKNYLPVHMHEDEDVSLDDVQAVFSDSEVSQAFFSCLLQFFVCMACQEYESYLIIWLSYLWVKRGCRKCMSKYRKRSKTLDHL